MKGIPFLKRESLHWNRSLNAIVTPYHNDPHGKPSSWVYYQHLIEPYLCFSTSASLWQASVWLVFSLRAACVIHNSYPMSTDNQTIPYGLSTHGQTWTTLFLPMMKADEIAFASDRGEFCVTASSPGTGKGLRGQKVYSPPTLLLYLRAVRAGQALGPGINQITNNTFHWTTYLNVYGDPQQRKY